MERQSTHYREEPFHLSKQYCAQVGLESSRAELLLNGGLISRVELSFGKMLRPGMMSMQGKAVWVQVQPVLGAALSFLPCRDAGSPRYTWIHLHAASEPGSSF